MRDHPTMAGAQLDRPLPARGLVRLLYTSNPFYIISADLVFIGLRMSFHTQGTTFETGALMLGLLGYTLLLATTALLLIRYGAVWDDARSLLLLVVMMFLATSVTFDNTLVANPILGRACFLGGWVFAAAVSEALLRGIRLDLPIGFRLPYHLILGLFFFYPLGLTPYVAEPDGAAMQWALYGFSTLAGIFFLALLPAVRRGPAYVAKNGSPWRWPLYPWVLFGLLALAVCARASYLCVSFHFVGRTVREGTNSIFGLHFLVPLLFALDVLLLESGLVARRRRVVRFALAAPLGILAFAIIGHRPDPVYQRFLSIYVAALGGSPFFLTLLATVSFYGLAALRRVPGASSALSLAFAALSIVDSTTLDLTGLVAPRALPLLGVAVLQSWLAVRHKSSRSALLASGCMIACVSLAMPESWPAAARCAVVFHLAMFTAMTLGLVFDDVLGELLQGAGAVLLLAGASAGVADPMYFHGIPAEAVRAYPLVAITIAMAYGSLTKNRLYYVATLVGAGAWMAVGGWRLYALLRQLLAGLDLIAWGLLSFVLAALISLKKSGLLTKWFAGRTVKNEL